METLDKVVDLVDDAIGQIRTSIFHLRSGPMAVGSLRAAVLEVLAEVRPILGTAPRVRFEGPVDSVGDAELVLDVRAVVREALTQCRSRRAATVTVTVPATPRGWRSWSPTTAGDSAHRDAVQELGDLEKRAETRGGTLTVSAPQTGSGPSSPGVCRWSEAQTSVTGTTATGPCACSTTTLLTDPWSMVLSRERR